jgi:hypothetical protein
VDMYSPHVAYCYRTCIIIAQYRAETEIRSLQDGDKLKDQNGAQRHGPRLETSFTSIKKNHFEIQTKAVSGQSVHKGGGGGVLPMLTKAK